MKRKAVTATALAVFALAVPAGSAFADAPPCEPGDPGCKTVDDPTKNNPKFTETQRGNVGPPGTENTCTGANPCQTKQVCFLADRSGSAPRLRAGDGQTDFCS